MPLPGDPSLHFRRRFNLAGAAALGNGAWVGLATIWVYFLRVTITAPVMHLFLASVAALCAADLWWSRRCLHSYSSWREVPAGLMWVTEAVLGSACLWSKVWLDELDPLRAGGGRLPALRHAAVLLWASAAPTRLLYWCFTMRLCWAVPLHIFMTAALTRRNREVCTSAWLATPAAEGLTHGAFDLLNALRYSVLVPASRPSLAPRDECAVVLSYLHICLGLVLPALVQAAAEARLFREHQHQRQRLGLALEKGWQLRLYSAIDGLREAVDGPAAVLALWVLLGILFDVSVVASVVEALAKDG